MGSTKKEQYQPYQLRYAQLSDAMGHPARVAIMEHMTNYFRANSLELTQVTKLSKSTVSQHLKELLDSKLLFERFEDFWITCVCKGCRKEKSKTQLT